MCRTFRKGLFCGLFLATFGSAPHATAEDQKPVALVFLEVSLNGIDQDVATFLRGSDGTVLASEDALKQWRIRVPPQATLIHDGVRFYALSTIVGLRAKEDPATQTVELAAPAEAFEAGQVSLRSFEKTIAEAENFGVYLNYDVLAERASGRLTLGASLEAITFTPYGVGATTAVIHGGRFRRLETSWTFDSPSRMATLRIGDSFSRGASVAAPVRFGGIQIARNFATQPGFLTLPLPSLSASAAAPSVVDIFVNNSLAAQREVKPGPFRLDELPVVTGSGDVRLVVRDALGRETIITERYYAASQLLRRGLHDFSYEIGRLRDSLGGPSDKYRQLFASGTHRYGLSNNFTTELHFEASGGPKVLGFAADLLLSGVGTFNVSVAGSTAEGKQGHFASVGFQRQEGDFSIGARGELTSRNYRSLGRRDDRLPPQASAQAFVGIVTGFGGISANFALRKERLGENTLVFGASANFRLGSSASLQISAQHFGGDRKRSIVGLFLTSAIGSRQTVNTSIEFGSSRVSTRAAVQQNIPEGEGFGYRVSGLKGEGGSRFEGWTGYQGRFGRYELDVAYASGQAGLRLGTSGTLGFMAGDVFAARTLTDGFAKVRVPGVEGVRVYSNNQLIGRTNKAGNLIIPKLLAYDANKISIEPTDVPFDFTINDSERTVRPYLRSGVIVQFATKETQGGLLKVLRRDGSPLPAGAEITNLDTGAKFIVAPGGEAYITGLSGRAKFQTSWNETSCTFDVSMDQVRDGNATTTC